MEKKERKTNMPRRAKAGSRHTRDPALLHHFAAKAVGVHAKLGDGGENIYC